MFQSTRHLLNSARARLTDECLGFGVLRRPTSCILATSLYISLNVKVICYPFVLYKYRREKVDGCGLG